MTKYIDADRLRARIEKYLTFDNSIDTAFYIGRRDAERSILALIDSLQQEQTEIDLGKEFDNFLEKENAYVDDDDMISYYNGSSFNHTYDIYPIARYFYKLGLKVRKEE